MKQGQYIVENRRAIADVEGSVAELGEGVLNNDTKKIEGVVLKSKSKQLALNKSATKIEEQLNKNWFLKMWESTITFFNEGGIDILIGAGKNLLTQNWGGLAMGLVAVGVEYMRRKEKKQKQDYACAINEIALENDEGVRKEKLKKTFNKKGKDNGKSS